MGRQGTKILVEDWLKRWTLLAGGREVMAEGTGRDRALVLEITDGELKEKEAMVSLGQSREGKFSVMQWSGGRRQEAWGWQLLGNGAKILETSRRGQAGGCWSHPGRKRDLGEERKPRRQSSYMVGSRRMSEMSWGKWGSSGEPEPQGHGGCCQIVEPKQSRRHRGPGPHVPPLRLTQGMEARGSQQPHR